MEHRLRARAVGLGIAAWALALSAAVFAYTSHATEAGPAAAAPVTWPDASPLARAPGRPTLLVLVHPSCPCSRATLRELERILARDADKVDTRVVFLRSLRTGDDPRTSSLWELAASIPGVTVGVDEGGRIARAFGAATSGQVFLYAADGALVFAGGVTQPGGHEGDNEGSDALRRLLASGAHAHARASVFGCPLFF